MHAVGQRFDSVILHHKRAEGRKEELIQGKNRKVEKDKQGNRVRKEKSKLSKYQVYRVISVKSNAAWFESITGHNASQDRRAAS